MLFTLYDAFFIIAIYDKHFIVLFIQIIQKGLNIMKKILYFLMSMTFLWMLCPFFSKGFSLSQESSGTHYTYEDIVKRTYDMTYLATEPKDGEGGKQITSTARTSQYNEETGKYENWDDNADYTGYVRQEGDWKIIADLKGPGYINHIMTGFEWNGKLRIEIDGKTVIDESFTDFVWGSYFSHLDQLSFKANVIQTANGPTHGMINLAVPITYNESCIVKLGLKEADTFFYTVGYYELEEGASVEPFTWPMSEKNMKALEDANEILSDRSVPVGNVKFNDTVKSGETAVIYQSESAGTLSATTVNIDIPQEQFDDKTSLVDWEIAMYWDGSEDPSVRMSVADFYGSPHGLDEFNSAGFGVSADGTLYSKWYMPYNQAKITLTNNSDTDRSVKASFASEALTDDEANELMRFHANWQRAEQRTDDRFPDALWLYVEGKGRYVGVSHHVYQIVDGIWWGEGDEKFFIDGEKYPTWFGTGSEDYFWYAWCSSHVFDKAYCGQPHNVGTPTNDILETLTLQGHGNKTNYRVHVSDSVCFNESLELNLEKYYNDYSVKFGDTTYFYLTKETSSNHIAQKQNMEERYFNNDVMSYATLKYEGLYLPMRLIHCTTQEHPFTQVVDTSVNGPIKWIGDAHMFWRPSGAGEYVEFELNIPESGYYDVFISKTRATDYGIHSFYIDGKEIGSADFYNSTVDMQGETIGEVALTSGEHILKIACNGKNNTSFGPFLGINYIEFIPKAGDIEDDNSGNAKGEKSAAKSDLDAFASKALESANDSQSARIRYTLTQAKIDINAAANAESVNIILSNSKDRISSILATDHDRELNVDYDPNAYKEAYYTGSQGLISALKDSETIWPVADQFLDPAISDDGSHLFTAMAKDHFMTFEVDIPASGDYVLTIGYTRAGDYGKFDVYIDGEKVGDTYDAYSATVDVQKATINGLTLTNGKHELTIKGADKNPASGGWVYGFDYVQFLTEPDAYKEAYYTGSQGLLAALKDSETIWPVADQFLDPAISDDGSHLFTAMAKDHFMTFEVDIPSNGNYVLTIGYTRAGDFGKFDVYIDGEKVGDTYDAYSAAVDVQKAIINGITLTSGKHELTIKGADKNPTSSGWVYGFDYVQFLGTASITELDAYINAAKEDIDSYLSEDNYTSEQWTDIVPEIAAQKAIIESAKTTDRVIEEWKNALFVLDSYIPKSSTVNVYYNANGGIGYMPYHSYESSPVLTNAFERTGYSFTGWNTSPDGSGTTYTANGTASLSQSVTLYAQWQKNEISTYTISGMIYSYDNGIPVTVTLTDNGTTVSSLTVSVSEGLTSSFEFTDIPNGIYTIKIEKAGSTNYTVTNIAVNGENVDLTESSSQKISLIKLTAGDIDGNGYIDSLDVSCLVFDLGEASSNTIYPYSDINCDGYRDAIDVAVLSNNLFTSSEEYAYIP